MLPLIVAMLIAVRLLIYCTLLKFTAKSKAASYIITESAFVTVNAIGVQLKQVVNTGKTMIMFFLLMLITVSGKI